MREWLENPLWEQLAKVHEGEPLRYTMSHVTFSVYKLPINLLTYMKGSWIKKIRVVGVPISVAEKGYSYTSEMGRERLIEWIKSQKGLTVVLNADDDLGEPLIKVETLPTVVLANHFKSIEDYESNLRAHYRYRIKCARNRFKEVEVREHIKMDDQLYKLYVDVYNRSDFKLEKSSQTYFEDFESELTGFYINHEPIGFVQYKIVNHTLYFVFCGINYEALKAYDTYYNMLLYMIEIGIKEKVHAINLGQTTEAVKQKLGGKVQKKYMYIHHSNGLVHTLIHALKPIIGYKLQPQNYRVFKHHTCPTNHIVSQQSDANLGLFD